MILSSPLLLAASTAIPPQDERWATIMVTASRTAERVLPPQVEIAEDELLERQPKSLADALHGLPGVSARTNSRGETIARIRGSEERQTQVFLDGAPLAVPWDGRADIGIIPAGLVGNIRVIKGAAPIEFGTNSVGGAVDFQTRSGGDRNLRAGFSAGSGGFADGSAVGTFTAGDRSLTLAASALRRDEESVASHAALPFSQNPSGGRTNTDLRSSTLFAATRFEQGPLTLRAYALHVRARRGIAPESDRDPALAAPRYWRYPKIEQSQLSLSSRVALDARTSLSLVGWQQWFEQRIDQYRDQSYRGLRAREEDWDDSSGGRMILEADRNVITLRAVATAQTSRHRQIDTTIGAAPGPRLTYRQNLYTFGLENDVTIGRGRATFGAAYDRAESPLTGGKPAQPDLDAFAFSSAYRMPIGSGWTLAFSGGRRTRFPTSRELYGEALGRFLANPDLRPETAWLADAELRWRREIVELVLNPFFARTEGTISQRVVRIDGRSLRQRFNLSGTTRYGLDFSLSARLSPALEGELYGTILRARADAGDAAFRRLPQQPSHQIGGALVYRPDDRLSLRAEMHRYGSAVDLGPNGEQSRLPAGNELNLRSRYRLDEGAKGHRLFLTASVDNLSDDVVTPQLGLPLAGRSFRIGVQLD